MLQNLFNAKHKPQAIIFLESKFSNINKTIDDYLKSIVCNNIPFCNKCDNCLKIDKKNYQDLIVFNGYKQTIKKADILLIRQQFSKSALEKAKAKFFILLGCDNTTKEANNSLLKFIEEPISDTYAIFTTRNINKVLPTIRSRCQVYIVPSDKQQFFDQIKKYDLTQLQKKVVDNYYFNCDEFDKEYKSGQFNKLFDFAFSLINANNNLKQIKELSVKFKLFEYLEIKQTLNFLLIMVNKNQKQFIKLINKINLCPTKILIFNNILELIK